MLHLPGIRVYPLAQKFSFGINKGPFLGFFEAAVQKIPIKVLQSETSFCYGQG